MSKKKARPKPKTRSKKSGARRAKPSRKPKPKAKPKQKAKRPVAKKARPKQKLEKKAPKAKKPVPEEKRAKSVRELIAERAVAKSAKKAEKPARDPNLPDAMVGKPAPGFRLADHHGSMLASDELLGKPYVLYFYPKDDTPGCTKEACDFRDARSAFESRGVRVVGVSPDSSSSHERFRDKYKLTFTLVADTDKTLARAYGVWVKKSLYGREYMGIERSTFLVDSRGIVKRSWRGVKVGGHVDEVRGSIDE